MKNLILLFALIIAVATACQNKPAATDESTAKTEEVNGQHEEDHSGEAKTVQLNNGQKWTANAETTEGIKNMSALINNFNDTPEMNDCRALKAKLTSEFDMLIQKCTMTGEAHDQLHNYLIPLREKFEALDSPDGEQCSKALNDIRDHLGAYGNYFV
jgi:hypothetical protein